MKKIITAALAAATLFGGTAAMAQPFDGHRNVTVSKQVRTSDHGRNQVVTREVRRTPAPRFERGQRFDYRSNRYERIATPARYHLRTAPRGYQWVRYGNEALLVGITSGIILSTMANGF